MSDRIKCSGCGAVSDVSTIVKRRCHKISDGMAGGLVKNFNKHLLTNPDLSNDEKIGVLKGIKMMQDGIAISLEHIGGNGAFNKQVNE